MGNWTNVFIPSIPDFLFNPNIIRYLKRIDRFYNNYVSCWITAGSTSPLLFQRLQSGLTDQIDVKFLLLHSPTQPSTTNPSRTSTSIAANPESPATEEAIKAFFSEVHESWIKTIMSPFYQVNMEVRSPVFRARVAGAGKKFL